MPHLTEALLYRKPLIKFTNYKGTPVFKTLREPALSNSVSLKGESKKVKPCLQEISLMLVCLNKHDFSEGPCHKEIAQFNSCMEKHKGEARARLEAEARGIFTTSKSGHSARKVNSMLWKYPSKKT